MAVEIVTTPGDAEANSYADVEAAEAYLAGRTDVSAWECLTADQKARKLIQASGLVDSMGIAHPRHSSNLSRLHIPTSGCVGDDGALVIPVEVTEATIELALALSSVNLGAQQALRAQRAAGVASFSEGRVSVSFAQGDAASSETADQHVIASAPTASRLLREKTRHNAYAGFLHWPGRRFLI